MQYYIKHNIKEDKKITNEKFNTKEDILYV